MRAPFTLSPLESSPTVNGDGLGRLQAARAYPSVSILLTTTPGATMTSRDVRRLYALVAQATGQLEAELPVQRGTGLVATIRRLATAARRRPATAGLAIFASDHEQEVVALPVPVYDRVVIAPTFATRDLLRAQTYLPRLRLLVLSERAARLYEGWPEDLAEVLADGFPIVRHGGGNRGDRSRGVAQEKSRQRQVRFVAHVREVEAALSTRRSGATLPLIVVGIDRHLAAVRCRPAVAIDLIGTIRGGHHRVGPGQLARFVRPVVHNYLEARRGDALARLQDGRYRAEGTDEVWRAAMDGQVELLCVEEGYVFTTGPVTDGRPSAPIVDGRSPDALDDAIDDAIKLVARAGGETVIVDNDALGPHGGIAARLRHPSKLLA